MQELEKVLKEEFLVDEDYLRDIILLKALDVTLYILKAKIHIR